MIYTEEKASQFNPEMGARAASKKPRGIDPVPHVAGTNGLLRPEIIHANYCARYDSDFARDLGKILKSKGFYRLNGAAVQVRDVTVKARNGEERQVKKLVHLVPNVFSTIIEAYCQPVVPVMVNKETFHRRKSISLDLARKTLVCPDFLNELSEITLWTDARLPVRSGEKIILTEPGYDEATGIYTSPDAPAIDETLTLEQAQKEWRELLKEFCFPKGDEERERCIAVALAAALTPLCIYVLPEKAKRPGFAASANAEGAGKTLLLSFGMVAKLGYVPTGSAPEKEEEMRKLLDSAAHNAVPIIFFDNLKNHLSSAEIEAFITSAIRSYRMLGTTNTSEANNVSTVYITANFATYSPDLRRRLLAIELFLEEARAEERCIKNFLDEDALIEMRPRLLSIFWTFIKNWHSSGEGRSSKMLPSFEQWSNIVGGIVESAGFCSPCQLASLKTGGDTETRDMEILVSKMPDDADFRFSELMELARDNHLFQRLIPSEYDMDKEQSSKMGKLVRKFAGRTFCSRYHFDIRGDTRRTERYFTRDLRPGES
jgi:hypothetical protein